MHLCIVSGNFKAHAEMIFEDATFPMSFFENFTFAYKEMGVTKEISTNTIKMFAFFTFKIHFGELLF